MSDLRLTGCQPQPLAHYLKALAVLRIVSEQFDAEVAGYWQDDCLHLRTRKTRTEIEAFFLEHFAPSPIISPWNGGSGFYEKDRKEAVEALADSKAARFAPYRLALRAAIRLLKDLGSPQQVDKKTKDELLERCRNRLPDETLSWLDAAFVLTEDGSKYPPLLGSGGNDGRFEFSNNHMHRLVELFDPQTGSARTATAALLSQALFDEPSHSLAKIPAGQFLPGNAGGPNSSAGFDSSALLNPWDFVLSLEGALTFASAGVKRLGSAASAGLSYPFAVRSSPSGFGSAADWRESDSARSRGELWLPLWTRPTGYAELAKVFSEGRARVGARPANDAIDFAVAVASLGVDRGLSEFQRYGFEERNGLSYFATPLTRITTGASARAQLLAAPALDSWLSGFRRRLSGKNTPASIRRAGRRLERSVIALCQRDSSQQLLDCFRTLGQCQTALGRAQSWAEDARIEPLQLTDERWLEHLPSSSELRIAVALASSYLRLGSRDTGRRMPLRTHLHQVEVRGRSVRWTADDPRNVVWSEASGLVANLNRLAARRNLLEKRHGGLLETTSSCSLEDVSAFLDDRTDDHLLEQLIHSCALLSSAALRKPPNSKAQTSGLPVEAGGFFSLLVLCAQGRTPAFLATRVSEQEIALEPAIHRLASAGNGSAAADRALRRLRGSSLAPLLRRLHVEPGLAERTAAATLIPLSPASLRLIAEDLLRIDTDN
ncbi:MAG: type I-U CRISPR-associated protein Csx17 [Acidobacteriota bacterium]